MGHKRGCPCRACTRDRLAMWNTIHQDFTSIMTVECFKDGEWSYIMARLQEYMLPSESDPCWRAHD